MTPLLTVPGSSGHQKCLTDHLCPRVPTHHHPPQFHFPSLLSHPATNPPVLSLFSLPLLFGSGARKSQPWLHIRISWGVFLFKKNNSKTAMPRPNPSPMTPEALELGHMRTYFSKAPNVQARSKIPSSSPSKPHPGESSPLYSKKSSRYFGEQKTILSRGELVPVF